MIQSKPSEKGEIITYLSRMGDVLDNIPESGYTESKERRCQQTVARMIKLKK